MTKETLLLVNMLNGYLSGNFIEQVNTEVIAKSGQ
jgi:hypothetical protein